MDKLVSILFFYYKYKKFFFIDPNQIMNLINSVTSGMNFNFGGNNFFNVQNSNNINVDGNYDADNAKEDEGK